MELRQLFAILRSWARLLGIGLVVGLFVGLAVSFLQKPVYEASAKLFVSKSPQTDYSSFAGLTNQQLVQTYVQILKTNRLRGEIAQQLGVEITPDQVNVQQVSETQIIEVTTDYPDPNMAAQIANALVQKIVQDDQAAEAAHFSTLETSLTKQIDELEKNIVGAQTEFDTLSETEYQNQVSMVEKQLTDIQSELSSLQIRIAVLTPANTNEEKAELAEKQLRVAQLQSNAAIYENIRANLVTQGQPLQTNRTVINPRLLQLQTSIDSYQKKSLELRVELESARQVHEHVVPNAEQIEEASAPLKPARPSRLMYAALGGIVGFMLAGAIMTVMEAFQGNQVESENKTLQEAFVPANPAGLPETTVTNDDPAPPVETAPAEAAAITENPVLSETVETASDLKTSVKPSHRRSAKSG